MSIKFLILSVIFITENKFDFHLKKFKMTEKFYKIYKSMKMN